MCESAQNQSLFTASALFDVKKTLTIFLTSASAGDSVGSKTVLALDECDTELKK